MLSLTASWNEPMSAPTSSSFFIACHISTTQTQKPPEDKNSSKNSQKNANLIVSMRELFLQVRGPLSIGFQRILMTALRRQKDRCMCRTNHATLDVNVSWENGMKVSCQNYCQTEGINIFVLWHRLFFIETRKSETRYPNNRLMLKFDCFLELLRRYNDNLKLNQNHRGEK